MLKFRDWVAGYGSPERLAMDLGVTAASVNNWLNRRCVPRVGIMLKIVALSKGTLTLEAIVKDTRPAKK